MSRPSKCHLPLICTKNPSLDHTYSLTSESIDELNMSADDYDDDDNCADLSDIDADFDDDEIYDEEEVCTADVVDQQLHDNADDDDDEDDDEDDDDDDDNDNGNDEMEEKIGGRVVLGRVICRQVEPTPVVPQWKGIMTRSKARLHGCSRADTSSAAEKRKKEGADALLNLASIGLLSLFHSATADQSTSTADDDDVDAKPDDLSVLNNNNNLVMDAKGEIPKEGDLEMMQIKEEPMDDS